MPSPMNVNGFGIDHFRISLLPFQPLKQFARLVSFATHATKDSRGLVYIVTAGERSVLYVGL